MLEGRPQEPRPSKKLLRKLLKIRECDFRKVTDATVSDAATDHQNNAQFLASCIAAQLGRGLTSR
jgi:hypothetical protein